MARLICRVTIARPVEDVFAVPSNPTMSPRWSANAIKGELMRAIVIRVQQRGDPFINPVILPAVQLVQGLNVLPILAPPWIIGVHDAINE
jgi:hypothetical protein